MNDLESMRAFMREIPFNAHLGIEVVAAHEDGMTISLEMRPEMRNGHGVLHGGVIATLADVALGVVLKPRVTPKTATTIVPRHFCRLHPQAEFHLFPSGHELTNVLPELWAATEAFLFS